MGNCGPVSVHTINLRIGSAQAATCTALLSVPERARAERFVREQDRLGFIASHAGLRCVLGDALGVAPRQVRIEAQPHHKPRLAAETGVHFNLTHAGGVALVAITRHAPLGVDVEPLRSISDMALVAERVFCDAELAAWHAVSDRQRKYAFFCGWTRKEALIKATGEGFRADLKAFCVALDPAARPAVLASPAADEPPWQLAHIEPQDGYVGAVAMRCETPFEVSCQALTLPA